MWYELWERFFDSLIGDRRLPGIVRSSQYWSITMALGNGAGNRAWVLALGLSAGLALTYAVGVTAVRAAGGDDNEVIEKIMKTTHKGDKSMAKLRLHR